MADVCLHSEFEIAPKQLTGRFRKFGTIADNTPFLSILFIYLCVARADFSSNSCVAAAYAMLLFILLKISSLAIYRSY